MIFVKLMYPINNIALIVNYAKHMKLYNLQNISETLNYKYYSFTSIIF